MLPGAAAAPAIGCLECKKIMIKHVIDELAPIPRETRAASRNNPDRSRSGSRRRQRHGAAERLPRPWRKCARRWACEHASPTGNLRRSAGPAASSDQEERSQHHRHSDRHHHRTVSGDAGADADLESRRRRRISRHGGDPDSYQIAHAAARNRETRTTKRKAAIRARSWCGACWNTSASRKPRMSWNSATF